MTGFRYDARMDDFDRKRIYGSPGKYDGVFLVFLIAFVIAILVAVLT